MGSLRRTKNFANDPQTPIFLYTILKQLDLRSINWNEVAGCLGISNGHAARMRYSRMKSQFEGTSNQVKPPKPKKETTNTADSKTSKTKPKNKRLIEEEENERLANQRAAYQHVMQPDHDPKRIKVEPQSYIHHPWYSMYTPDAPQMYPSPFWGHPTMPVKAVPQTSFGMPGLPAHNVNPTPVIKTEPNTIPKACHDVETAPPAIKQEDEGSAGDRGGADVGATIVKKEPGTTMEDEALATTVSCNSVSVNYPLSRTINTFFGPQQSVSTSAPSRSFPADISAFSTAQNFSRGSVSHPPFCGHSQSQNALPWSTACASQNSVTTSTDDAYDQMVLNPYAVSYQDMLNMPLYRVYTGASPPQMSHAKAQNIAPAHQSGVVEAPNAGQNQDNNHGCPSSTSSTTATAPPAGNPTTKNSDGGASTRTSVTPLDTFNTYSESAAHADTGGKLPDIPDIVEVDSDDEGEGKVQTCLTTAADCVAGPRIKKEGVGL
ncbi:hypothetical protein CLAIMM_11731 [Cladophialophora immunda]|nr:hypothetical protein CLAIMM_11731 [Cladophialophora immunda]